MNAASDSSALEPRPQIRSMRRLFVLALILVLVLTMALLLRGSAIRLWWLERQTTEQLQAAANTANADAVLRLVYGKKLLRKGDATAALEAFNAAEKALPPNAKDQTAEQIFSYRGYLLAREGRIAEALPLLKQALAINDNNSLSHVGVGIVHTVNKKFDFAVTEFQLATALDAQNVEAWFRLGRVLIEAGKAKDAVEPLKTAIVLAPNDSNSHAELGVALGTLGRYKEAIPSMRQALTLDPDNVGYRASLAGVLASNARSKDEYREAKSHLEEVLRSLPNDPTLNFLLGQTGVRFGDYATARAALTKSVTASPDNLEAWYNLAQAERRLGNIAAYQKANATYKERLELRDGTEALAKRIAGVPRDPALRRRLAGNYERGGNLTAALVQYQIALGLQPDDATRRAYTALSQRYEQLRTANALPTQDKGTLGPAPPEELLGRIVIPGQQTPPLPKP